MNAPGDPSRALSEFAASREFFIGIDSDGCVFDTMEVKHKECFIPNIIKCYGLAAISKYVREAAEFINLYSQHAGREPVPGPGVDDGSIGRAGRGRCVAARNIPALTGLRGWIERETRLVEPGSVRRSDVDGRSRPAPGPGMERSGQSIDPRNREGRPAVSVRPRIAREHAGQGGRDGGVGHARRGLVREWEEHGLRPWSP